MDDDKMLFFDADVEMKEERKIFVVRRWSCSVRLERDVIPSQPDSSHPRFRI
jgi:hypothetical protein